MNTNFHQAKKKYQLPTSLILKSKIKIKNLKKLKLTRFNPKTHDTD